ncbi:MAG: hypothetical protein Q9210_001585 [Variospora velana]
MEETILESIRYAADRMTFEVMEDRPVLLDRFSETFRSGTLEYFNKHPRNKAETLRQEQSLRSTLNTHVDAAMVRRIEKEEQSGWAGDQFSEVSDDQSGNSAQKGPETSHDSPAESDTSLDYGYDDLPTTSETNGPNLAQQPNSETVDATHTLVTGTTVTQKDIEQKLVDLIQDLLGKYDHDQLASETKALLRTAFQAYEKYHAGEDMDTMEVPEEEDLDDAELNELAQADPDIASVKEERQHTRVKKEEPEVAPKLDPVPTSPRSVVDQHHAALHNTPCANRPPIPTKFRICERVFPSGKALKRHRIFSHGEPLEGLWPDPAERGRNHRLYLQEGFQHEGPSKPPEEDAASVRGQPSEGGELPLQPNRDPVDTIEAKEVLVEDVFLFPSLTQG